MSDPKQHPWRDKCVLVVGAGFTGAVIARQLADFGVHVRVIDRRDHIAGNAYDEVNQYGIRVHRYGPHLFHTSDSFVVEWLSKFTDWTPYKHRVKALLSDGTFVTLPVNKETKRIVGEANLLDTFYRPYTRKMWGLELEDIDPEIYMRVPIRDDLNEFYFPNDSFQALPTFGYTALVAKILEHHHIKVQLGLAYSKDMEKDFTHCFNCMPIDEFFNFELGELPYRSIRFHTYTLPVPQLLPVATVNFTHSGPYTRVTEWSKLPEHSGSPIFTTLTVEEPCDYRENFMERYYPVKDVNGRNRDKFRLYKQMVARDMTFVGRCGTYAYLDMHQAVRHGLSVVAKTWRNIV